MIFTSIMARGLAAPVQSSGLDRVFAPFFVSREWPSIKAPYRGLGQESFDYSIGFYRYMF